MTEPRVVPWVVISPVRDESRYIHHTLDSMLAQTVRPAEWIVVDDGSTDDTAAIVEGYAARHPWIRLVRRPRRETRALGSGVVAAFNEGKANLRTADWRYISKVDGDLSFTPRYAETMIEALEREPKLACVSGKVFRPENGALVEEFILDESTSGAFKFYRREAFEAIGGFSETILWDVIDWHRSRMRGWDTRSFHHPEAKLIHHRLMGSSDKNVYRGRVRLGKGLWFVGYHPLYALASGVFRMHEKPRVVGGLIIFGAYCWAALRREPRFPDRAFIDYLRRWQLRRLAALPGKALRRLLGSASAQGARPA